MPVPSETEADEALARVREIQDQLEAGASFEELAAETNPDATATRGGRVGEFRLGQLAPDYERAAIALDIGEISEPVRTQFGYHLIRLEARRDEPVSDADNIRERVHYELQEREAIRQEELYLERMRDDAYVDVRVTEFGL